MSTQESTITTTAPEQISETERIRRRVRSKLAERGWNQSHLSIALGISDVLLTNVLRGKVDNPRQRRRIEKFLKLPLWSTSEEFERLNHATRVLGIDPILTHSPKLLAQARSLGLVAEDAFADKKGIINLAAAAPLPAEPPALASAATPPPKPAIDAERFLPGVTTAATAAADAIDKFKQRLAEAGMPTTAHELAADRNPLDLAFPQTALSGS